MLPLPAPPGAGSVGTRRYRKPANLLRVPPALADARSTSNVLGLTHTYLRAIGAVPGKLTDHRAGPITSLVPEEPGLFHTYMAKGEDALRRGDFLAAFSAFRIADDVGRHKVESLLGLAHSRFATGGTYASASYYLQQALRTMPELPLSALKPEALFGTPEAYRECLVRLARYVKRSDPDAPAQLLLAYFLWFEGKGAEAEMALAHALAARKSVLGHKGMENDLLIEAVGIFRRGMAAGGKVPLVPNGVKSPATRQPADPGRAGAGPAPGEPAPTPGG